LAPGAFAQSADTPQPRQGRAGESAATSRLWIGYPGGLLASPWSCRSPGCAGVGTYALWITLERQRRFEDLRQGSAAAQAPVATGLWLPPPGYYLPPPTPEKSIQPQFRDRSVVRPEFRDSGQVIR